MKQAILSVLIMLIVASSSGAAESICYGTTNRGRLENSVKLSSSGSNFRAYSKLGSLLQRTYVHSKVRYIIMKSYVMLETATPKVMYIYGETGWRSGGRFKPHKTHQNGLSVDFMVPLITEYGEPVQLKTSALNKFGYAVDFDSEGRNGNTVIDYESLAEHLYALHVTSREFGAEVSRVFFAPDLQPYLFATKRGQYLKENIKFNSKQSWVRHDDHYHVDFDIPCKPYDG